MKKLILYLIVLCCFSSVPAQTKGSFQIIRLKYNGGGDWYNGQTEEPNLLNYIKAHTNISVDPEYKFVDLSSDEIFYYPFLFLTGHGNIVFTGDEVERLRKYFKAGGFLYVDDDYGLDKAFKREIKKVFPEKELVELPFNYGLYHDFYNFPNGVPKIHEHDGKSPQGFGIFLNNRLAVYYTYESNPSDGWDSPDVHNDPLVKREEALKFGTNLVIWVLSQ
jgi:Domain of unknown function (DUF4159)